MDTALRIAGISFLIGLSGATSLSLVLGHRLLTDRGYRGLVATYADFPFGLGLYLGSMGVCAFVA